MSQIDKKLSEIFLEKYRQFKDNSQKEDNSKENVVFPSLKEDDIIDLRNSSTLSLSLKKVNSQLEFLGSNFLEKNKIGKIISDNILFEEEDLYKLGLSLLPFTAFGILNGGSATSYLDTKKNKEFCGDSLFSLYQEPFNNFKSQYFNLPKGITPAYVYEDFQGDVKLGESYLELKLQNLINFQEEYKKVFHKECKIGLFQMTSFQTDPYLESFYESLRKKDRFIRSLIDYRKTGIQKLVYAFSVDERNETDNFRFFSLRSSEGNSEDFLSLPAGHGQSFRVLKSIYQQLEREGYRYAYLGNIDNFCYTLNPVALAIMALKGNSAGFEFSFKTPMDKKGGVLVRRSGALTCLDMGGGIDSQTIEEAEKRGDTVLFNCATGLLNLLYLNKNIDFIIENLPVRFIEQNKEIGRYIHAEQSLWEVISLLKDPLIFCVNKQDRFLSAKFVTEMFLTSGLFQKSSQFPQEKLPWCRFLYKGLVLAGKKYFSLKF